MGVRKVIDWTDFQSFYDSGKTVAECCELFGISEFTAYKHKKFAARGKSDSQRRCVAGTTDERLLLLKSHYDSGASWRELKNLGFSNREYEEAKKNGLIVARSVSEGMRLALAKYPRPKMSDKARRELSERQSLSNSGGKSRWYTVSGVRVQGTWERDVALKFEELGVKWTKPKTNSDIFRYEMDGKIRSYSPDFYLPDYDIYVEVKGYWWGDDRRKMDIVIKSYPEVKFLIVEKDQFEQIKNGNLSYLGVDGPVAPTGRAAA
jgi:hypothetical protein